MAEFLDIQITVNPGIRKVKGLTDKVDKAMREALDAVAIRYKKQIKFNVNNRLVNRQTGRLFRSVYKKLSRFPGGWQAIVGARVPYSVYVDQGTIYITPRRFMEQSFSEIEREINGIFQSIFRKAFR
jgi:HK97 gp10 family phage protein